MKHKLFLVFVGSVAFIGASLVLYILQMIVGGFLPNNGPDPAAKMEPTPQQRSRQEYQQAVKEGRQPPLSGSTSAVQTTQPQQQTQQSQQQSEPTYVEPKPQQTYVAPAPKPEPAPAPQPAPVAPPPPPRGPGDLDAPAPPAYYRSGSAGPGNM